MLVLLRLALGLYFVGLVHSVLTIFRKKETIFRPAAAAMIAGFICDAASIAIKAYQLQSLPLTRRYESFSFSAALAVRSFFIVYWQCRLPSLAVSVFPL